MSYNKPSQAPAPLGPTIALGKPAPDTFNEVAHQWAKALQVDRGHKNASSQLRRFYDEVLMWQQRIRGDKDKLARYLPLIQMLNAKASYAYAREHVTETFTTMMRQCLAQIDADNPASLDNFKLFFEAVMGFRKYEEELTKKHGQGRG